jgi:two-component system, chemotaxis family, sensor kinase CheA
MMTQPGEGHAEQFQQSFREEARDVLVELESALLALNENRGDTELVGRIFRGLHTMKGSGAMFGFEQLAGFVHDLETAFDMVRNGRLAVTPELIDLTLRAADQIGVLLEEESTGAAASNAGVRAEILAGVRSLAVLPASPAVGETRQDPVAPAGMKRSWRVRFAPGPDMLRCGANPLLLLRELRSLGDLSIRTCTDAIPSLAELDPERCYFSWDLALATSAGRDAIRDIFIFVEDACELSIAPDEDGGAEATAPMSEADKTAQALVEKRSALTGRRLSDKQEGALVLRVPAQKLDQFVNLVGELVTVQARLSELARRHDNSEMAAVSEEIERLTSALRENSMSLRMVPIRGTFEKFRRLVHDLARDLGKEVELTVEGADTELDKTVIDQLGDPLMHLIRNSMDHGIESVANRVLQGKHSTATIHLSARYSGASVVIAVADDGRGIDVDAVRRRAVERGLAAEDAVLTEKQIFSFIFQPGFSTAKQVTDLSGRGVGMDVVRQRVESLRGSIDVSSQRGRGTRVALRLPLTLAIIDGLLVTVGDGYFVLPLRSTLECVELTREDVERREGNSLVSVRGELVPYIRLREYLGAAGEAPGRVQVMIVESEAGRCGLVVDSVVGGCQTVIRNLGRLYRHVRAVSGATILGDGTLALILDPQRLIEDALRAQSIRGQPPGADPALFGREQVAVLKAKPLGIAVGAMPAEGNHELVP